MVSSTILNSETPTKEETSQDQVVPEITPSTSKMKQDGGNNSRNYVEDETDNIKFADNKEYELRDYDWTYATWYTNASEEWEFHKNSALAISKKIGNVRDQIDLRTQDIIDEIRKIKLEIPEKEIEETKSTSSESTQKTKVSTKIEEEIESLDIKALLFFILLIITVILVVTEFKNIDLRLVLVILTGLKLFSWRKYWKR